jgi:hypothetical protein
LIQDRAGRGVVGAAIRLTLNFFPFNVLLKLDSLMKNSRSNFLSGIFTAWTDLW